jgi:hypothetical protein
MRWHVTIPRLFSAKNGVTDQELTDQTSIVKAYVCTLHSEFLDLAVPDRTRSEFGRVY